MKFVVATKPFADGLDLAIINQNVTQYFQKSCVTQLTAQDTSLIVNVEVDGLMSEIRLKGKADVAGETKTVIVDSLLLKQLVGTFEDAVTTLEFVDGGLVVYSGKSHFTLPQLLDAEDIALRRPAEPEPGQNVKETKINKEDWKFVKDNQLYAIATAFLHPVYGYVWVGENGDVLVGDVDTGMFTHSAKGSVGSTCLLKGEVVNLLSSLPDGAVLQQFGDNKYVVSVSTDGFTLISEFVPSYEDSDDIGNYHSEMIFGLLEFPDDDCIEVSTVALNKILSQADLFSRDVEKQIKLIVNEDGVRLVDDHVDGQVKSKGQCAPFEVTFKTKFIKAGLSHYDQDNVKLAAIINDDEPTGILLQSADLTTVIAGLDDN